MTPEPRSRADSEARWSAGIVRLLAALAALLCSSPRLGNAAVPVGRYEAPPREAAVTPELLRPRLATGGGAWESWEWVFGFESGYKLLARVQVTNSGPGDGRALVVGMILAPDGRSALIKNGRPRDRWTFAASADGARLTVARHEIDVGLARHRLSIENSRGRFSIEAEPELAPIRVGRVALAGGRFYELLIVAPRLRARGVVQFPGEAAVELGRGSGIAMRSFSNVADHELADVWLSVHSFDRQVQLSLVELTTTRRLGQQRRFGILLVTRERELLLRSEGYDRVLEGIADDPLQPGYPLPRTLRLAASEGGSRLSGEVALQLRRRDDLLDWLGSRVLSLFVRLSAHPVQYLFDARYALALADAAAPEALAGHGIGWLTILNQPPPNGAW